MDLDKENYSYQNIHSTTHFVVDVVIGFCNCSIIKEPGKELFNCVHKGQSNTSEFRVVGLLAKQFAKSGKEKES